MPDEIVEDVVRLRLDQHDWNYGFVLDGFPRTRSQAEYLFENWDIDRVIYLDIPDDVVFGRIMLRAKMGQGSGFTKRADDNAEALKVRLREYTEKTSPLLEFYEKRNLLLTLDGNREVEDIYLDIRRLLGLPEPRKKR